LSNGIDPVDFLRKGRVDLVFTAYLMPQIDGLQVISIIRAFNAHVPICMTSNIPMQTVALARGATGFLFEGRAIAHLGGSLGKLCA
jgi:CheY-like chemotaxis protein